MMSKNPQEEKKIESVMSLGEYARIFWRNKYFLIIPIFVSVIISAVGVRFLKPMYSCNSTIQMRRSDFLSEDVTQYVQNDGSSRRLDRAAMDRETLALIRAEILNTEFLDKIIIFHRLNMIQTIVDGAVLQRSNQNPHMSVQEIVHRKLWGMLRNKINVNRVGPGMFMISFFDSNPQVCFAITQTITNLFVEEQVIKQMRGLQNASDFSDEQLAIYKEQLQKSEHELSRVKTALAQNKYSKNPVIDTNIRNAETLLKTIETRREGRRSFVDKTRSNAMRIVGILPSSEKIWGDQTLSELQDKLVNLREIELVLELSTAQDVSAVDRQAENQEQILDVENEIQSHLTSLMVEFYPDIPSEHRSLFIEYFHQNGLLLGLEEQYNILESFIGSFRKYIELIPELENAVVRIEQEVESNRELYYSFLRAKTSAQISEAVAGGNLGLFTEIIEHARVPFRPDRPNKMKIIIMAVMFGGSLGLLTLFISEYSNTSFKRVDEIENILELKVLGVIPNFEHKRFWNRIKSKSSLIWSSVIIAVVIISISGFYYYGKYQKNNLLKITSVENDSNLNVQDETIR